MKEKRKIDLDLAENIMSDFSESSATSLEIKKDKFRLSMKKRPVIIGNNHKSQEIVNFSENTEKENKIYIESDRVGRFFSANPPDSPQRLKKGDFIPKGTKIANIVSMNVVYDILAPFDLKISECLAEDGDMLEYGQAVFEVISCGGNE